MTVLVANNAVSRLAGGLSSAATTLGVMPGDGAKFPAIADGNWFPLTLVKSDGTLEIVKCTAREADALTIARAQEGTQALEFSAGDRVELRITKAVVGELQQKTADAKSAADAGQAAAGAAQSTASAAGTSAAAANTAIAELDLIAVKKTSATGLASLPEGDDAQRPAAGSIPAGVLAVRGNTQDPADYKPEFWNRVAAAWQAFASRPWVTAITDALIARIAALEGRQLPLGQGQTWQDMSGSRVANTNYTNNTGRTIAVFASLGFGTVQSTRIFVAGVVAGQWVSAGSSVQQGAFAIIPAGSLYQVRNEQGGGTVQLWAELRT